MSKLEFTAEDFEYNSIDAGELGRLIRLTYAANTANFKLAEIKKEWEMRLQAQTSLTNHVNSDKQRGLNMNSESPDEISK